MSDEIKSALASESAHWYDQQGAPVYEIMRKDGSGMRPTTLADARKLNLFPSVTKICNMAAKPGLEIWKATQLLEASLTLPIQQGETVDDYASRIVEDSKAQSQKAMDKGKSLHAAIEQYIRNMSGKVAFCWDPEWEKHIEKLTSTLIQYGVYPYEGKPEHSFYHPSGYGGKVDWHTDEIVIDFKTKDKLTEVVKGKVKDKKLAWPEHVEQLAAYSRGLHHGFDKRLINVFIGVEDCEIRIHEWTRQDYENGWAVFEALLKVWQIRNNYNGAQQ